MRPRTAPPPTCSYLGHPEAPVPVGDRKPVLYDIYCGAGGAAKGYMDAGFEVWGIDNRPRSRYIGDRFIQMDALEFVAACRDGAYPMPDAWHASPPCQSYLNLGAVNRARGRAYDHPDLIAATRMALLETGRPYVIENVVGAPLRASLQLCGTSFDLPARRHRLFETSVLVPAVPCRHERFSEPRYWTSYRPAGVPRLSSVVQVYGHGGGREHWPAALGIDWMTDAELAEAIPPAYTRYIGRYLLPAALAGRGGEGGAS